MTQSKDGLKDKRIFGSEGVEVKKRVKIFQVRRQWKRNEGNLSVWKDFFFLIEKFSNRFYDGF